MSTNNLQYPNRLHIDDKFGSWFSGFFDGEGSFIVNKCPNGLGSPRIRIGQRSDDQQVLDFIKNKLCIGNVTGPYPTQKGKPVSFYQVTNNKHLAEIIIPLFEAYPLHSKKSQEYLIWKEEVLRKHSYFINGIPRKATKEEVELTQKSKLMIEKLRKYNYFQV
ncbi:MAG: LAGLIDADG family homing endonuclease [Nostoc sp. LLA-1]|nr:LAGLIDADG family homing endonuclease [Cyanocohniella sp. LLY]